jgi:predicted MPP superfamily phosphohydrolase
MHYFAYRKLRSAFQPQPRQKWLLILLMAAMTVAPLLVRAAEHFLNETTALLIAWPGFIWMGFIFIFAVVLLFIDLLHVSHRLVARMLPTSFQEFPEPRIVTRIALALAVAASIYSLFEAKRIRTEHVVITTAKLDPSVSRVRIVQISDVHVGLLMGEKRLRRIIKVVRGAEPDIFVSTGDLVDGKLNRDDQMIGRDPVAELLASIPAPSGKFAIVGNHEVYAGLPQALEFSRTAGFTLLRNRSITLASGVTISGVDDLAVTQRTSALPVAESTVLGTVSPDSFHLLLKHRPDISPKSDGRFDLQLSGHVHDGQIFPFNFLVKLKHSIPCGTTTTSAGSRIHVSRGTGTWGPPMRLFAPPEVTVIDVFPLSVKPAR